MYQSPFDVCSYRIALFIHVGLPVSFVGIRSVLDFDLKFGRTLQTTCQQFPQICSIIVTDYLKQATSYFSSLMVPYAFTETPDACCLSSLGRSDYEC